MSRISLTASMQSNLFSLQNISRQVSSTQNRLATGNKVNSAIDNPSSYYTARALNNRADDLNALLDSMGQAVSTIKAATTALEAGADFLEQAAAVANGALENAKIPAKSWFEQQDNVTAVVSTWDELKSALDSGKTGNIVVYGNIAAQDTVTLGAGQNLVGVGYYGVAEPDTDKFSQLSFDLEKSGKLEAIKTVADNIAIADISIKAVVRKSTKSSIIQMSGTANHMLQNIDLMMDNSQQDDYSANVLASSAALNAGSNISIYGRNSITETATVNDKKILGYGVLNSEINLFGDLSINVNQKNSRGISVTALKVHGNSVLNISSKDRGIEQSDVSVFDDSRVNVASDGSAVIYGEMNINGNSQVNLLSKSYAFYAINTGGTDYPLTINLNSATAKLNISSERLFGNQYNNLNFNAIAGSGLAYNGQVYQTDTAVSDNTMDSNVLPAGFVEAGVAVEPFAGLGWLHEQNADRNMEYDHSLFAGKQYSDILSQYDSLVKDAAYKGNNLLEDSDLNVQFSESSELTVQGKDMSAAALGFRIVDWQTQGDIAQSLAEISAALQSIRSVSAELGNNYNIITNRQDFTENLINILTEGADKLTLADMNEESANMLALQTRQQLAVNSLSLASQASQAVLKLF